MRKAKALKVANGHGDAKVTLSLQSIVQGIVMASLLGAAGYATTKLSNIPSPQKIEKIEASIEELNKAREASMLRTANMEKDVARLLLDVQDVRNSIREQERIMRRWTDRGVPSR